MATCRITGLIKKSEHQHLLFIPHHLNINTDYILYCENLIGQCLTEAG